MLALGERLPPSVQLGFPQQLVEYLEKAHPTRLRLVELLRWKSAAALVKGQSSSTGEVIE